MSSLGITQKCNELTAFRVDQDTIPPGTRIRRYYMHQFASLIDQMQPHVETGSASLAQYLSSSVWQQLALPDRQSGLESEVVKEMVVLEAIFEHTRKKLASPLPSRLDCVFVWPALELAKQFQKQYFPAGVIHRCKIQGEAVQLDGGLLPPGIRLTDLSLEIFSAELHSTQLRAEQYWKAQVPPKLAEMLVVGDVEVVRIEKK